MSGESLNEGVQAPSGAGIKTRVEAMESALDLHRRLESLESAIAAVRVTHSGELQWDGRRWVWLLVGLGALGLCVGAIAGLSSHSGISKVLLTSVMTFGGGSLMSYAGFRWRRGVDPPRVDPARVGISMAVFAIMTLVGAGTGIAARDGQWLVSDAAKARAAKTAQAGKKSKSPAPPRVGDLKHLKPDEANDPIDRVAVWRAMDADAHEVCADFFAPNAPALADCGRLHVVTGDPVDRATGVSMIELAEALDPKARFLEDALKALPAR